MIRTLLGVIMLAPFAAFAAPAAPVAAQTTHVLSGRVVERGVARGIASASVQVGDGVRTTTGENGEFRVPAVRGGRVSLTVTALGYEPAELAFVLARDTALMIELEVAPVTLDAVEGRARTVTVRGVVREKASGAVLMRTEVTVGERRMSTDLLGRFRANRVVAGQPVGLEVRAFGYLPVSLTLTAERDTTLQFELEPDAVMLKMITAQVDRIEKRYLPRRSTLMPPINRSELMKHQNTSMLDLMRIKYEPSSLLKISCLLIDDIPRNSFGIKPFKGVERWSGDFGSGRSDSSLGVAKILEAMLPDQFERVEVMQMSSGRPEYMMRLYTRDYIARMTAGGVTLKAPVFVVTSPPAGIRMSATASHEPLCR